MKLSDFMTRKIKVLGIIGAIFLAFSLGYRAGMRAHPGTGTQNFAKKTCDLRMQACTTQLNDGKEVELNILPKNIPSDQLINVTVTFKGFTPEQAYLSLVTMTQKNDFVKIPLTNSEKQVYTAHFKLNNFGSANQQWLLLLKVITEQKTLTIPFKFQAE